MDISSTHTVSNHLLPECSAWLTHECTGSECWEDYQEVFARKPAANGGTDWFSGIGPRTGIKR